MANSALCGGVAKNLGQPSTVCKLDRPSKFCFQAQTATDDGVKNSILTSDTVDDTYVTGMIQTGDKTNVSTTDDVSKRWFPTSSLKQLSDLREDQNTEEIDGFNYVTSEGVRNVSFAIVKGATPELYGAYKSREDLIDSFYTWSTSEQIGGNGRVAGELRPFRIETGTFRVVWMPENKAEETAAKIMVYFSLSDLEKDEDIAFLAPGDGCIEANLNINDYEGLVDVNLTVDSAVTVTATTATIDAAFIYGSQAKKSAFTGAVAADFTVAGSAITSSTEVSDGKYELVFPSQSTGTVDLDMFKVKFYTPTADLVIP